MKRGKNKEEKEVTPMRKLELSWRDLEEILHKEGKIIKDELHSEEIREITLMKPKKLRIYVEGR